MLPKTRRIARAEFPKILKNGKRYNSENLLLYVLKINPTSPTRFSFSVSKKVKKLAVDRNRCRRQGYSAVRSYLPDMQSGHLCFFSFKKNQKAVSFSVLENEIVNLLRAAGVLL